ncbi:adenylosuccinate synthetase [bacterium]|nr:adenylosuccinate synthetase [bacterium]
MKHPVVVGLQYGDEGKGKITDILASQAEWVIRFNGGNNAGHTLYLNGKKVVTHSVPSGVLYPGAKNFIGASCVVDPIALATEIEEIKANGAALDGDRLKIDFRAHVTLPIHIALDESRESGAKKIGSTKRGIGPTYMTKMDRVGIRISDLFSEDSLEDKISFLCGTLNPRLKERGMAESSVSVNLEVAQKAAAYLKPFVSWAEVPFHLAAKQKRCLLEGAQGVLLDMDHGSYPFVTSSNTLAPHAAVGTPFPMKKIGNIIGIAKAYLTRVGEGPMASELSGDEAEALRKKGGEYGATTGRPRRIGWLNLDELRLAVQLSDCTGIVLSKADVLVGAEEVGVYKEGKVIQCKPWAQMSVDGKIDPNLEEFISLIEKYVEIPVVAVGTGPERKDMFWRTKNKDLWEPISG